jgi:hypothetical protein
MLTFPRPLVVLLCTGILGTGGIGCGPSKPREKKLVYSAAGTLKFNGKPADGAWITLVPDTEGIPTPTARVKPDGKFLVEVFDEDVNSYEPPGDPTGDYKVLVSMPRDPSSRISPDRLGGVYSDASTAKNQVIIELGENELEPISLDGVKISD